jgi:hypothetical protein
MWHVRQAFRQCVIASVCILLTASCHKRLTSPATIIPASAPVPALPSAALPSAAASQATPKPPNRSSSPSGDLGQSEQRLKPSGTGEARAKPIPKLQGSLLDQEVPVKLANGSWGTIRLAQIIRETLFAFTPTALNVECPTRMRVGSTGQVRLTTRQNLTDLLREQLRTRGIPAEYLIGIETSMVADLIAADDGFAIQPEAPADKSATADKSSSKNTWVWRARALKPGDHQLHTIVTVSARIPLQGELGAKAAVISRTIAVEAAPGTGLTDFLDRYGTAVAGSLLAVVLGAGLIWALWRPRITA